MIGAHSDSVRIQRVLAVGSDSNTISSDEAGPRSAVHKLWSRIWSCPPRVDFKTTGSILNKTQR